MLRAFTPKDFDPVVTLIHACGLGHPPNDPERDLERILEAAESRIFVHTSGDESIDGAVVAAYEGRRGWIYYVAVAPEARHRGLGMQLVRHAESWLKARGAPKVLLLVRDDNLDVMSFYRGLGYQEEPCTCMGRWLSQD